MCKGHSPGLCKVFSSLRAFLLCVGSQFLLGNGPGVIILLKNNPISSAGKTSSWVLWWACDHANQPSVGVKVRQSLCHDVPWLPWGPRPLAPFMGWLALFIEFGIFLLMRLVLSRFYPGKVYSLHPVLSSNPLIFVFCINTLLVLGAGLIVVCAFLAHIHSHLILLLLNFF